MKQFFSTKTDAVAMEVGPSSSVRNNSVVVAIDRRIKTKYVSYEGIYILHAEKRAAASDGTGWVFREMFAHAGHCGLFTFREAAIEAALSSGAKVYEFQSYSEALGYLSAEGFLP
jgi:hypothetical protein